MLRNLVDIEINRRQTPEQAEDYLELLLAIEPDAAYERFQRAVARSPWILECHHVSGAAAFVLKAAVPDVHGLELLVAHLSQYGDTATSLVLSSVLERRIFRAQAATPEP
mgnify:CR=1 FL=1